MTKFVRSQSGWQKPVSNSCWRTTNFSTKRGCKPAEHLEASVGAAAKGPWPDDILDRLDEIAAMLPQRPWEEPMILPFGKNYYGPGIANMGAAVQVGKLKLESV